MGKVCRGTIPKSAWCSTYRYSSTTGKGLAGNGSNFQGPLKVATDLLAARIYRLRAVLQFI
jgi:hypothetical protein